MLGSFEVRTDDGVLADVRGARLRALLIALALEPGRVVPKATLTDWIWGEHPPFDAANAIRETQAHGPNCPIIADGDLAVSKLYGMLPAEVSGDAKTRAPADNQTVRNVFVIGPDKKITLVLVSFTRPDHFAAHYNGHVWVKVQLPGIIREVSALSPTDIWVLGVTTASALKPTSTDILMHWNGKTWSSVRIPKVNPPPGAVEFPAELAATGPADAWLQRDIDRGSAGARTLYLLHWNGRSWTRVKLGFPTSLVDSMTQDGHGGVWMVANGPARAFRWLTYHLNAGHWTRYTVPVAKGLSLLDLMGISWIPGTRSVWLTANMAGPPNGSAIFGTIRKFGP